MLLSEIVEKVRLESNGLNVAAETEAARVMQICNACRYCEGFCAVFPAMTRRLEFGPEQVHFLANLCHNCGACLHACQYAPPHEFMVNVPQALAKVRKETYTQYAWPSFAGRLYANNGLTVAMALALSLVVFLVLAVYRTSSLWSSVEGGNFYAIFPHGLLVSMFGWVSGFVALALSIGLVKFWRSAPPAPSHAKVVAGIEVVKQIASLKYLDGGHGDGCHDADDKATHWRRRFHHLTFYGFLLCFASTSVATFYHYVLKLPAPYPLTSLPVVLGMLGGVGLAIGPIGLFALKRKRHPLHGDKEQNPMDYGFIALLFFTGITGIALTLLRETNALALLLAVHLGFVMALFLTMPYGKFAHGFFRGAALLKWAIEKRQPSRLRLGE